jgi:hypothetical protein
VLPVDIRISSLLQDVPLAEMAPAAKAARVAIAEVVNFILMFKKM